MDTARTNWKDAALACLTGIAAFVIYALTRAVGAYPGDFSAILSQSAGLFPRLAPDYPLWFMLAPLLRGLGGGDVAAPFNMFSAVCGGLTVGFLCLAVNQIVLAMIRVDEDQDNVLHARIAGRLAGVGAALALAGCIPFWVVSTRSHWAPFHLALFLGTTLVFLHAVIADRRWAAVLFGFLFGVGVVEYPAFLVFGLPFAGVYLAALWKREALEAREWGPPLAACVLGLGLYAVAVWQFLDTPGYVLREHSGFWEVLWSMWRDQWNMLAHGLPREGWLVVLIVTIVPACVALVISRRALNGEQDWTYYILHLVLTALAVVVVLNLRITPWALMGYRRLLIMPYVLQAAMFGYLLAYWYLLPAPWRQTRRMGRALRTTLGLLPVVAGLALLGVAGWRNLPAADGRSSAMIREFAAGIVKHLAGREWLVTDGTVDGALLVEARRQGVPLRLLPLGAGQNLIMQKYIGAQFEDARMRNLVALGTPALLRAWLEQSDGAALEQVAIMTAPDLLASAGYQSIPAGGIFLGRKTLDGIDAAALMQDNRDLWTRALASRYFNESVSVGPLDVYRQYFRRHLGLVANNLGVLMEDVGRKDDAYEAYVTARKLDPRNVSALMNQYTMLQQGFRAPDAEAVRKELEAWGAANAERRPRVADLTHYYGYVRAPRSFANMGWEWAMAGQEELAASSLRRAMGLVPEQKRGGYKQALAGLYLMQNRDDESEALFYELLVENPNNQSALLGMARIELQREDASKAREYLERAKAAGVPDALMQLEWAAFHVSTDDLKQAKEILREALEKKPDLVRALSMMTAINIQERDALGLVDTIRRIGRVKQGGELLLPIASGYLAMMQEDLPGAYAAFEKALVMRPGDAQILEWLVRLDVLQGQPERMEAHLRQLLRADPSSAIGNFILGALQMERRQFDLARDSLARSLETERSPEALNDLAWLLQESGLYKEAEAHAREALKLRPELYQAWDTLGVVLMQTERLEEARAALNKALALEEGSVPVALHLVELDVRQGRRAEALRQLDELEARRSELSSADREAIDALRGKL